MGSRRVWPWGLALMLGGATVLFMLRWPPSTPGGVADAGTVSVTAPALSEAVATGLAEGSDAGPGRHTVTGRVVDRADAGLEGAEVEVLTGLEQLLPDVRCLHAFAIDNPAFEQPPISCRCGADAQSLTQAAAHVPQPRVLASTKSGPDGTFSLEVAAREDTWALLHANKGALEAHGIGRADPVVLVAAPRAQLEIAVRSDDGQPVPDARLIAVASPLNVAITDAQGRATLTVPRGPVELLAVREGLLPEAALVRESEPRHLVWLTLARPITVTGRVELRGASVAGAKVRANFEGCQATVVTDTHGNFSMEGMRRGSLSFVATKDGLEGRLWSSPDAPIVIPLSAFVKVEVVTHTAAGEPVKEVWINWNGSLVHSARNDPRHPLGTLEPGPYTFSVSAKGFERQSREVELTPPTMSIDFTLVPGLRLAGVVSDPGGRAIPEARVEAHRPDAGRVQSPLGMVGANALGIFTLDALPPGPLLLEVSAAGFLSATVPAEAPGEGLRVTLARAVALRGRVRTEKGLAARGADVFAWRQPEQTEHWALADTEGQYQLDGLEPGPYEVLARVGMLKSPRKRVTLGPGENQVDLRLPHGATIVGVVRDENGAPIADALVTTDSLLWSMPGSEHLVASNARTQTDAQGAYRLDEQPDQELSIYVRALGCEPREVPKVRPGGPGLEVVLERTGVITGRALGDVGPLTAFEVNGEHVQNPEGRFAVSRKRGPTDTLRVVAAGYATEVRTLEAPKGASRDVGDVRLTHGRTVDGRVVDARRAGVAQAQVRILGEGFNPRVETDATGGFRFEHLPARALELEVRKPGLRGARVALEPQRSEIEVQLDLGLTVEGRVIDERGDPVGGFQWSVFSGPGPRPDALGANGLGSTGVDGRFTIPGLSPGRLGITGDGTLLDGGRVFVKPTTVTLADSDVEATLYVLRGGATRLSVSFVGPGTAQLRLASLDIPSVGSTMPDLPFDFGARKPLTWSGLSPGRVKLTYVVGDALVTRDIELGAAGEQRLEIPLEARP